MNGKTILVTGASGFTGQYFIAAARKAGYRCVALCHRDNDSAPGASEIVSANLLDKSALNNAIESTKPDYVLHLAAVAFVAHEDVSEIYQTNLLGTLNLLNAVAQKAPHIKRIIVASSANIYGNTTSLPISESNSPAPANHYGVSKYAMEMAASMYVDLPLVLVRPFNYTGVGQSDNFLIPKIVNAYRRKSSSIELGNLDVARDFSDVRDVASAYLQLMNAPHTEAVYNICSGTPTSLDTVITSLNRITGYQIEVRSNPKFVRADEIKTLYGSSQRLEGTIGDFRQFSFDETLAWMLSEGDLG